MNLPLSLPRQPKPNFKKENNIRFVYTHDGILLPLVPGVESDRSVNIMCHEGHFAAEAQAEALAKHERKTLVYKPQEVPHLKRDLRYHRNSEKNIEYLRTCHGTLLSSVYTEPEESVLENYRNKYSIQLPPLACSNLDFKLYNPLNNLRRNKSQINFFSSNMQ
jgi:hypothetical protein